MNSLIKIILLFLFLHSNPVLSQESDSSNSPITKLDDSKYKIGNLLIDTNLKEIIMPGKVNMQKGLIEVLACSPGGKLHESIIVLDIAPYHLQVALLLLGLNPVDPELFITENDLSEYGQIELWVKSKVNGSENLNRAEEYVWDKTNNETMKQTNWVFRGSKVVQGTFVADNIKSLITTYNDPTTIIDNPLATGKNDEVYEANFQIVPPNGTDVDLIIKVK